MEIVANNPKELTYVRSDAHLMGQVVDVTPRLHFPPMKLLLMDTLLVKNHSDLEKSLQKLW